MGTPEFAIESLGKILSSSHQIEAVVTWANQVRTKYALQIEEPQ